MLFTVGWLGVLFLPVTGFETDLGLITGRPAAVIVSAGSLLVLAIAGSPSAGFSRWPSSGATPSCTSSPLRRRRPVDLVAPGIAKILGEMGLMCRNFGQLPLVAGMANDVIGQVALGLIAALRKPVALLDKLAFTVVGLIVFFVIAFTVGQ